MNESLELYKIRQSIDEDKMPNPADSFKQILVVRTAQISDELWDMLEPGTGNVKDTDRFEELGRQLSEVAELMMNVRVAEELKYDI